jgi:putative oxygen-independent coproporphyrinogen III oxidase
MVVDPLTGMEVAGRGVYLHFPYCLRRCPYCDFAIRVQRLVPGERYAEAVLRELDLRMADTPEWRGRTIDSVYLGGGTPSLWEPAQVARVLEGIDRQLPLAPDAEVTLEANPEVADGARLAGYRLAGVNRLSIGVQSFRAETLATLGRTHRPEDGVRAVEAARQAGFDNLSVDLIVGVSGQRLEDAVGDARQVSALAPEHVSAYVLTVERHELGTETVFSRRLRQGRLELPPEETVVAMVDGVADALEAGRLHRYEISSYARSGRHARHNALYWTGGESLGLGSAAVGFRRTGNGAVRTTALRSVPRWMEAVDAGQLPDAEREPLGPAELYEERLLLGLRLFSGLDLESLWAARGVPPRTETLAALQRDGFVEQVGHRVRLTRTGAHLHGEITARLV